VSGEVGIGLGVILGGQARLGAAGYAGEAGHTLVNPAGTLVAAARSGAGRRRRGRVRCSATLDPRSAKVAAPRSTR
jgi:predicted NBD/HSP70 family sugar kinase